MSSDNEEEVKQQMGFVVTIINGPNLNLLGRREPGIYGNQSFEDFLITLKSRFTDVTIKYVQSNIEGELINMLHSCMDRTNGIILNAGGYTHTSVAIADAVGAIGVPVIEVHISNILAREDYRKTSFISAKCIGSISGLGLNGYGLAIQHFLDMR